MKRPIKTVILKDRSNKTNIRKVVQATNQNWVNLHKVGGGYYPVMKQQIHSIEINEFDLITQDIERVIKEDSKSKENGWNKGIEYL